MNSEIRKILCLSRFFKSETIKEITNISFEKPSLMVLNNIRSQYLQYTYNKTHKDAPIYINKNLIKYQNLPYGYLQCPTLPKEVSICEKNNVYEIINPTEVRLYLVYPKQDIMQHFVKWQRYRKYWWSSITTTPSLFSINDMKQENNTVNVNTVANFPWGQQIVENILLYNSENDLCNNSHLVCKFGLENALFTIMLDALSNATKEEYLRLHSKMAPFNISFAIYSQDQNPTHKTLIDLAKLIAYKLKKKKISTFLPKFSLKVQDQVKENLQLGTTYTVILSDTTIKNGVFHLLNSSTMLNEQIHIADFEEYAQKLSKK